MSEGVATLTRHVWGTGVDMVQNCSKASGSGAKRIINWWLGSVTRPRSTKLGNLRCVGIWVLVGFLA